MSKRQAQGHARHRGGDKWQLEVDVGKKVSGSRRPKKYKTIVAKNQKDADAKLAVFVNEIGSAGFLEPKDIGFVDFINSKWVHFAIDDLSATTFQGYVDCLNNRVIPAFQHFKLDEIKQTHIIDFIKNISEKGMRMDGNKGKLSSSQIVYHYRALNHVIKYALTIKFIINDPFEGVSKPAEEYEEIQPYSLSESIALFDALEKEKNNNLHWYIAIRLAVLNGMRRSELYGLDMVDHIDLENNVVKIRQALTHTTQQGYQLHAIKKGSRRAKRRDIAMAQSMIEPFNKLLVRRKEERLPFTKEELWRGGNNFLLLSHPNGKPFHPDSMRDWWVRFLKRNKLRYVNIHALRHTMVNLLIELDTPLSAISKRAGHSGIGITSDTYGHRIQSVDEVATEKLDTILSRSENTAD